MPGWRVMHLLYLGGALGGATVGLYQNGGCDEDRGTLFVTKGTSLHVNDKLFIAIDVIV